MRKLECMLEGLPVGSPSSGRKQRGARRQKSHVDMCTTVTTDAEMHLYFKLCKSTGMRNGNGSLNFIKLAYSFNTEVEEQVSMNHMLMKSDAVAIACSIRPVGQCLQEGRGMTCK